MGLKKLKTVKELGKYLRSEFEVVMKKDGFPLYAKILQGPRRGRKEKVFLSCSINTSLAWSTFTFV